MLMEDFSPALERKHGKEPFGGKGLGELINEMILIGITHPNLQELVIANQEREISDSMLKKHTKAEQKGYFRYVALKDEINRREGEYMRNPKRQIIDPII